MSTHSVAEAESRLPELIDRVLGGEDVVITRDGEPVVELKAVAPKPSPAPLKRLTPADVEWVAARRVGKIIPKEDAGEFVSRMRDEEQM